MIRFFLLALSWPFWIAFSKARKSPVKAQEKLRNKLFKDAMEIAVYRKRSPHAKCFEELPISEYEDLSSAIENKVALGRKVLLEETTSGSSAAKKVIPHSTKSFFNFTRLFLIWLHDILRHMSFKEYTLFLSISPGIDHKKEDDEYLPWIMRVFFGSKLCIPKNFKKINDPAEFRKALAKYLISKTKLEIISIWNPSYLLVVVDEINKLHPNLSMKEAFPSLKFISCWGDGGSKSDFNKLKELFPGIEIQKKGLLSTEFAVSVPLFGKEGHFPLVQSVYYEFEKNGKIYSITEIQKDTIYSLILSQSGGFIRYRTHDQIRVCSADLENISFEFIGRDNKISDMVGEKLNATFVENILTQTIQTGFSYLTPMQDAPRHYLLVSDNPNAELLLAQIELLLEQNTHYAWAKKLGQLTPLQVKISPTARDEYLEANLKRGLKLGDIKYQAILLSGHAQS